MSAGIFDEHVVSILANAPMQNLVLQEREDPVAQAMVAVPDRGILRNRPVFAGDTPVHHLGVDARERGQVFQGAVLKGGFSIGMVLIYPSGVVMQ